MTINTTGTRWDDSPTLPPPFHLTPQSCEQLGICQHPDHECVGGCEMIAPGVFESQPEPAKYDRLYIAVVLGVSTGVIYGAGRWAWSNFSEQITAFFWAAVSAAY